MAMQKRHDNELNSRLERILTEGCVFISWLELYLWYDVQKLAAATYRDLEERWQEISEGRTLTSGKELGPLRYVQAPARNTPGMFLFGANMVSVVSDD